MPKRIIAFILSVATVLSVMGCKFTKKQRFEAEFLLLFDTVTKIISYADTKEEFTKKSQFIYDELKIYNDLYDIYKDYPGINNVKTINDNAGKAPVKVDKKIVDMLLLGREMYFKTNGKINIAMGSVLKIWHEYRERGIDDPENAQLPPMEKLKEAAKHTDINNMIIDKAASTVYLKDPAMSLDVGSIGKGYATEQVSLAAKARGINNCLLSVGGNIRATDGRIDGTPWNVGIQNPDMSSADKDIYNVTITNASVVTSGNYQRYYTVNGKNYNHIINPDTLMPADFFASVTIICMNSGLADSLSTSVFNMPYEQGKAFIEGLKDTEAVWIMNDGSLKFSSGFKDKFSGK